MEGGYSRGKDGVAREADRPGHSGQKKKRLIKALVSPWLR